MGVPGNANTLLLRTAAAAGGYQVSRSLRFNAGDSAFLSKSFGSAGDRKKWTWSCWLKRSALGSQQTLFDGYTDGSNRTQLMLEADNTIRILNLVGGSVTTNLITTAVFRDPSAWYHVLIAWDTAQGTSSNRVKVYINGTEQTSFSTATYPGSSENSFINAANAHDIGRTGAYTEAYLGGYLADIWFLDGIAATPSDFAETDATTGQWIPKAYTGSKGTNGFHLEFADNSAATASTLGKDTSGNSNNWTPNNFSNGIGNGRYLSTVSTNNGSFTASQEAYFGFDGNTGTFCSAATAGNSGGYMDINVPAWNRTGSVEILANTQVYYSVNGATAVALGASWTNVGNAQSITTLRLTRPGTSNTPGFYAIRVNSVELIDYAADSGNDCTVDTPTSFGSDTGAGAEVRGNYCTLNPLNAAHTYSNGNLDLTISTASHASIPPAVGSIGMGSGKWYFEFTPTSITSNPLIGITAVPSTDRYPGYSASSYGYYASDGWKYNNASSSSYGSTWAANDVIGVAFDSDAGKLWFSKNGTWQASGNPASGTNAAFTSIPAGTYFPSAHKDTTGSGTFSGVFNFGQRAFAYTAPSGFKALCDTNLTAPVVAKPSTVMDVKLYTGNGSTQKITTAFSPDLVWIKSRGIAYWHRLNDSVRGVQKFLYSNATDAEGTSTTNDKFNSFDSDGFTLGSATDTGADGMNQNGLSYVAWCWDAGTSTVTNTQGSITSSVRANTSAGCSVVSWTATGNTATQTVGHGLGVAPELIITKSRTVAQGWQVYHKSLASGYNLFLHLTNAAELAPVNGWLGAPTSSVITLTVGSSTNNNVNNGNMVAYCFAPVAGYSSAFSYTGNGSSDGPMVYLGFRPRFILQKRTDAAGSWLLLDTSRDPYNAAKNELFANSSIAEYTNTDEVDFLSNGFKVRCTFANLNASGGTFIGYAFAENPFQYARAR